MWSLRLNNLHRNLFLVLCLLLPVQLGNHFWPNFAYVMGLRIDYLSPTIYLTDLLVAAILGLWIWERISRIGLSGVLRIAYYVLRNYWWVLAVFVYLLIGSLLAQNPGAGLYKFAKIVEFSLLALYVAKNRYQLSVISYQLSLAVIFSSLLAITQFVAQSSLGGVFWWLGERTFTVATPGIAKAVVNSELLLRPYATFPHPNALAGFLLVGLILTLPYLFRKQKLLVMSALALSFSRSAWLVGLFLVVSCRRRRVSVLVGLLLVVGYLFFGSHFWADEAISQRLQLIKAAVLMIQSNSLSGVGLNNFLVRLPEFWGPIGTTFWLQPVHNIYLLIAAETGLTGLLVFFWFLFLTFRRLLKIENKQSLSLRDWKLIIPLLAILLTGMADHYWLTLQQNQLLFAIVLGLCWGESKSLKGIKV